MDLTFWLLDITYEVTGAVPEIRMYGISEGGERVLVVDREFRPYFYVLPAAGVNLQDLVLRMRKTLEAKGVVSLEVVRRRYLGKERDVVKVVTTVPERVRELRERVRRLDGVEDVLEADIRFYMRYMIDNEIRPCSWIVIDRVEEYKMGDQRVDRAYVVRSRPRLIEEHKVPELRVMAFDIEVYNPRGAPSPERDPVIIVATMCKRDGVKIFSATDVNDKELIREFVSYVSSYDPDVILGYNSNRFDWPYLVERGRRVGVPLKVTRAGGVPKQSVYGHWSVIGRANVDLYNIIEDMPDVKPKSLDYVAEYFGIMRRSEMVLIPGNKIHEYWRDPGKRDLLFKYAEQDVYSTHKLGEKLLPFLIQLSSITGLPLDQVAAASVGSRVEWMIMYAAYKLGELMPNRVEREHESYRGAIVLEPRKGVHENVAVIDFTSMYPNIMLKYNVSPDTYVSPDEHVEEFYEAPGTHHRFRKKPMGLYAHILSELLRAREHVRELMRRVSRGSTEWILLDERQRALKVLANAMYGYCGWTGARLYRREVAEAVTAWGRELMRRVLEYARRIGIEVIYGDTDSLFVKYDRDGVEKLIKFVRDELGFDVKVDKVYRRVLFTEAKKRYIGLDVDGKIDVVGFEAARGDWAEIAKRVQERVAEIILKSANVDDAIEYVHSVIQMLREYKFSIDDLIIWKTLDKDLDEYKVLLPHVVAASRLRDAGYRVGRGGVIGYVIVRGGEKVSQRAVPYMMLSNVRDVDVDYYIEKQVLPAALRILRVFGVKEDVLISGRRARSILDYLT